MERKETFSNTYHSCDIQEKIESDEICDNCGKRKVKWNLYGMFLCSNCKGAVVKKENQNKFW